LKMLLTMVFGVRWMVGRGGCRNGRKDDLSNIKDMYSACTIAMWVKGGVWVSPSREVN
jgi:hypothetical protein